ncbi:hypothetical protein V5O48_019627, partial [Marasmius crinis-equi]
MLDIPPQSETLQTANLDSEILATVVQPSICHDASAEGTAESTQQLHDKRPRLAVHFDDSLNETSESEGEHKVNEKGKSGA